MSDGIQGRASRAWDGAFDEFVDLSFTVQLSTNVSPWSMIDHPGIEHWTAQLCVEDCGPCSERWAVAAEVDLVRADLREAADFTFSVSETAFGLEQVADDIQSCGLRPEQVLMVQLAVVDDFWRGRGLGPALVWQAARRLGCRFVALEPHAFQTGVAAGQCVAVQSEPFGSEDDRGKVRHAWRRRGFEPLTRTTWFSFPSDVMAPYTASVQLLDEASGYLNTKDADDWLTERHEDRLAGQPPIRVPRRPRDLPDE